VLGLRIPPFLPLADAKIIRGMFGSRQTRLVGSFSEYAMTQLIHVTRAGASIVAAYGASKFAIRGLTQAAGMPVF
jgi:hypothetical protein